MALSPKRRTRTRAESRARYYIRDEAAKRGWNPNHLTSGGNFLEENEIAAYFPNIGLGLEKPDFLLCLAGEPVIVVEAKNDASKLDNAISEAIAYAEQINRAHQFSVKIAVGAAGEEDTGFIVETRYLSPSGWVPLTSKEAELTTIPSIAETELALASDSGTTSVSIPASHEFIDAAIELSVILRKGRVEPWLRPRVIGAIVLSMYQGSINVSPEKALSSINSLVEQAISSAIDITDGKKQKLIDALTLSGADFDRLAPSIGRIASILRRLNVRSVLQTDTDFLGMFYEAFLRYGYDNNALGIVFTPRHITRFCVELTGATPSDRIIDIASGTGGFLVAAFDTMLAAAKSPASIEKVKSALYGFDTNPTVWALASLNMFFRGDGESHIELGSSLESEHRASVKGQFTRAFLNPPFSQDEEPERDFINAALEALEPEGILAVVAPAGIFADEEHIRWRRQFLKKHTLLAVISLPEDLFYPTSAPTSILLAQAHIPQDDDAKILMARIWNDGYEKLKGRRIERLGSQLDEVKQAFDKIRDDTDFVSPIATTVRGLNVRDGVEWSPQQWLPQPQLSQNELANLQNNIVRAIYQSVAQFPELADEALSNFGGVWQQFPDLPLGTHGSIEQFFDVTNGQSSGEKNYADGTCAYISSGDTSNSIVRLVSEVSDQCFNDGAITVTAFGTACVQPWRFMARGNGGSSVRVLVPKYNMSFRELVWFAAQINSQKWRFFYARMAIMSRLKRLQVSSPLQRLKDDGDNVAVNIKNFHTSLESFSRLAS